MQPTQLDFENNIQKLNTALSQAPVQFFWIGRRVQGIYQAPFTLAFVQEILDQAPHFHDISVLKPLEKLGEQVAHVFPYSLARQKVLERIVQLHDSPFLPDEILLRIMRHADITKWAQLSRSCRTEAYKFAQAWFDPNSELSHLLFTECRGRAYPKVEIYHGMTVALEIIRSVVRSILVQESVASIDDAQGNSVRLASAFESPLQMCRVLELIDTVNLVRLCCYSRADLLKMFPLTTIPRRTIENKDPMSLFTLDLSHNRITHAIFNFSNYIKLDLSHNQITRVGHFRDIHELHMENNPISMLEVAHHCKLTVGFSNASLIELCNELFIARNREALQGLVQLVHQDSEDSPNSFARRVPHHFVNYANACLETLFKRLPIPNKPRFGSISGIHTRWREAQRLRQWIAALPLATRNTVLELDTTGLNPRALPRELLLFPNLKIPELN